jgi:flagellar motor switch protein FliN/FliY
VIRALLSDSGQAADYLGGTPDWQVSATMTADDLSWDVVLWLAGLVSESRRPWSGAFDRCAGWETVVRICPGVSRVAADELAGLEIGDVVLLDACQIPGTSSGPAAPLLVCGGWRRYGRWLDKQRIEVISGEERDCEMAKENSEKEALAVVATPGSAAGNAGALEVAITVEVGEIRMSVREASGLVPGRILKLDRELGPEVVLKVGDRVVGRGELVSYEGTMAVEVRDVS